MKKQRFWSLSRLLLWGHIVGIVTFYLALWLRTRPPKEERLQQLPPAYQAPFFPEHHPLVSIILPARDE